MLFLTIIVINSLTQVFNIPSGHLITIVSSGRIGCLDSSGWGKALRLLATDAIITTTFSIMTIILKVFLRLVKDFSVFGALRRLKFNLLRTKKISVKNLFFGILICLGGGLITPETASIYFSDQRRKVKSGFDFWHNIFLDSLLPDVFLATILIGLGMDI